MHTQRSGQYCRPARCTTRANSSTSSLFNREAPGPVGHGFQFAEAGRRNDSDPTNDCYYALADDRCALYLSDPAAVAAQASGADIFNLCMNGGTRGGEPKDRNVELMFNMPSFN